VKLSEFTDKISVGAWRYCIIAHGHCVSWRGKWKGVPAEGFKVSGDATLHRFYYDDNELVVEFKFAGVSIAADSIVLRCSIEDLDDNVMAVLALENL